VVASEHRGGTPSELCCIADATVNQARAAGHELVDHLTAGTGNYGAQASDGVGGRKRPMSSARAPGERHIRAALAVIRPGFLGIIDAPARGISRGARKYFDPRAQHASHRANPGTHCHPLVILERWTYSLPWGATRCSLGTARGGGQLEWIGPIGGVNAFELMLLRPAGRQQDALYAAARHVIESQGLEQTGPSKAVPIVELLIVVAFAAAAAALAAGGRGGWV
jgi:hypothetical protein